jgi:HCOMODA/2-hydroxy-3-carboxy-muconic semialdehyde decarboxylase
MAAFISGGIPVFDLGTEIGVTNMLVNDPERGGALAATLEDRPAVLIRGHGVAVVGPNLPYSVGRSIYLELNARLQLQAMGLGGGVTYLDPREAEAVLDAGENRGYERPWEMWKRQAMGQ